MDLVSTTPHFYSDKNLYFNIKTNTLTSTIVKNITKVLFKFERPKNSKFLELRTPYPKKISKVKIVQETSSS